MATKRTRSTTTKTAKAAQATATPAVAPEEKKVSAHVTTQAVDLHQAIRSRAYELYEQRGHEHGRHIEDWLRAESEVLARFRARTA